ncbi:MAG: hypothetical protein JWP87_6454 [Labilithrix sp.]|jgi:hypothetical protein|nr:hypothetical protein [Labilithrix sp.]
MKHRWATVLVIVGATSILASVEGCAIGSDAGLHRNAEPRDGGARKAPSDAEPELPAPADPGADP